MKIRALKTTYDSNYGSLPVGRVAEIADHTARELIALGYAIEELPLDKQEAAPSNDNIPLAVQTGSQTGADPLQSLLQADPVQSAPTLPRLSTDTTLDSSPSTTDTSSTHGQTPSTPATTTGGKRNRGRSRSRR
jgi:hypothetical protein